MLPLENRLIKNRDFDLVYKAGRFFSHGRLIVKIKENTLNKSRIGIVVGIKISSRAVDRNKIRRWIRGIVQKQLKNMKTGFDIVIIPKKGEKSIKYIDLEDDFMRILEKSKLNIKKI